MKTPLKHSRNSCSSGDIIWVMSINFSQRQIPQSCAEVCALNLHSETENDACIHFCRTSCRVWRGSKFFEKVQSSRWIHKGEPRLQKAQMVRNSNLKVPLILFFESKEVVYYEYVLRGKTGNSDYYLGVLQHLRDAVRWKRPHYWQGDMAY